MIKGGKVDPRVKDVLKLLGTGSLLAATIFLPGTAILLREYEKYQLEKNRKEWEKFNVWRLRQVLKRLHEGKMVEVINDSVRITDKGRDKLLKYDLEEMSLSRKIDGKWRLIIYDVSNLKKTQRELFRQMLKRLKFLQLQKSVYLTPFVCDDEIEYLRQLFDIGNDVMVIKVAVIENESVYKKYFGI